LVIVSHRVASSLTSRRGGLAATLHAAIRSQDALWLGWSGRVTEQGTAATQLHREGQLTRMLVDLQRGDYDGYIGFANRVLWPLFHDDIEISAYRSEDWSAYCRVNALFADRLAPALAPDDDIWIHNHHLIPLGAALRRRGVQNRIGFFLHTPFPAAKLLTILPVHEPLMRTLFAFDLVGFQTDRDVLAFGDYLVRDANGRLGTGSIAHAFGGQIRIGAFASSIDTKEVAALAARAARTTKAARLRNSLLNRRLVIGVDRLEHSSGLGRRYAAVEKLLDSRPHHRRAVVVLQIVPLTPEDLPENRQILADLDACMGRINGRFGEPDLLPMRYLNRPFRQETLFGVYRASRVAMVTPLRDGMNLVAKEFVASQAADDPGVLVLSRFAGAAQEMDAALLVNPFDIDQVADALDRALTMPREERRERHVAMMMRLKPKDVHAWSTAFLDAMRQSQPLKADAPANRGETRALRLVGGGDGPAAATPMLALGTPPKLLREQALFLDFDGTLVDIAPDPALIHVTATLKPLLAEVATLLDGEIAIVSGRPIGELYRLLAPFRGVLVGQHGIERGYADGHLIRFPAPRAFSHVHPILAEFAAMHEGVIVEHKGSSLALHYRQAPALALKCQAVAESAARASGGALEAINGKMVVELVPEGGGKGGAIAALLVEPPFVGRTPVFVGDDSADEEGFAVVERLGGVSIHVGAGTTAARHCLGTVGAVHAWLKRSLAT
jgi:trehalose 6-phosphate synthase